MSHQLTEKRQKLYSLFKIAIEEERKAQKLYSDMLQNAEETSLKNMLESFIKQEKNHEETLLRVYSDLRKTDEFKD